MPSPNVYPPNVYPPNEEFVKRARVKGMEGYRELYQRAAAQPDTGMTAARASM